MDAALEEIVNKVQANADKDQLMKKTLVDWRQLLAHECQVYVFGDRYIAKRFDQINYRFCDVVEAKQVVIDNLYALLRFKYFTAQDAETDERIADIVKSFTTNLKSTLKKVSFDTDDEVAQHISMLPDSCVAFRNGVYDFKANNWLFKYKRILVPQLSNIIYLYDEKWVVLWYININFEPFAIDIMTDKLEDTVNMMKVLTSKSRNLCFELMYNMGHDMDDKFDIDKFRHLCEVMGYTICQSFIQHFVVFVGAGGNGKNTLFDGAFSNRVVPAPAHNDLHQIEEDNFITGGLENKYHNIYLETSTKDKPYEESQNIKNLTGSTQQSIHSKGINKYSGYLNVKFITSANDQEKIKFKDTSPGFMRRINVIELFYRWDPEKSFLKMGDYYDTSFSDDYREMTDDVNNIIMFVYFAMYGIKSATKDFTRTKFDFTKNDWKLKYADVDLRLKERIERITNRTIASYMNLSNDTKNECKELMYDVSEKPVKLFSSESFINCGYSGFDDMVKLFQNEEMFSDYFANNDFYINVSILKYLAGDTTQSETAFTKSVKTLYKIKNVTRLGANKSYVKARFINGRLRILGGQ